MWYLYIAYSACLLAFSCDTSTWGYKCELSVLIITTDFYSLYFVVLIDRLYRSNYFNVMIYFFVKSTVCPFFITIYVWEFFEKICSSDLWQFKSQMSSLLLEQKSIAKQDDAASREFRENQIFVSSKSFLNLFKHTYWVKTQFFNTRTKGKRYKNLKKTRLMCPPIKYYSLWIHKLKNKFLIQRHWGWTLKLL